MRTRETGTARLRREDPSLLRGEAEYTDDHVADGTAVVAFSRCPYGHARIESVDLSAAGEIAGVIDVVSATELADRGGPTAITTQNYFPGPEAIDRPILVGDRARFAGDPVAAVLAEDRYRAHAAADAITVEYDRLPAVTDPRKAADADAPSVGDDASDTLEWETGDAGAVSAAFETADTSVSLGMAMPRLVSAPMEPRALLCEPTDRGLEITTSTQTPHQDRDRIADTLGLDPDRLRVRAPAVGGGFGPKGPRPYPEEPLVAWWALETGRPVRWTATRSEAQRTDHLGRGLWISADLAVDDDGTARGLRIRGHVGVGGYPLRGPSSSVKGNLIPGPYEIPAVHCALVGALTNSTPLGPYRGAGRPEAIFIVERLLDRAADALEIDPAAIRRRNFIPAEAFPYETPLGYTYDSGDYATALERALKAIDYEAVRAEQAAAREDGRYLGIGIASFVENTGSSGTEAARVSLDADGTVNAACGSTEGGQGHATAFSQLLADELGVDFDAVQLAEGDTAVIDGGTGTYGCRSVPVGLGGLAECARDVIEQGRQVAADHLEAAPEDVEFDAGRFHVSGAPAQAVDLETVAGLAATAGEPLSAERLYQSPGYAYAFGTHAAVVEVSADTGEIDLRRYVAVDDCGVQLNPMLVDGQVHGGVAQGLGQALCEAAVYDEAGTPLTGSFQDYALHRAHSLPDLETESTETPSPVTAHGAKGIGEAGTIAAPPTVVNAVVDALGPLGVTNLQMPLTEERVWRAVEAAS